MSKLITTKAYTIPNNIYFSIYSIGTTIFVSAEIHIFLTLFRSKSGVAIIYTRHSKPMKKLVKHDQSYFKINTCYPK